MLLLKLLILTSLISQPEDLRVEQLALDFVSKTILEPRSEEFKKLGFEQQTNGKLTDFQFFFSCFYPKYEELQDRVRKMNDEEGSDASPKSLFLCPEGVKIRRKAKRKIEIWNPIKVQGRSLVRIDLWTSKSSFEAYFVLFSESGDLIDHCVTGAVY